MKLLYLFALACTAVTVSSQLCGPAEVLFLLDQSENAQRAGTTQDEDPNSPQFDILKEALLAFLTDPRISNSPNFRVGAIGYSSSSEPNIIFPTGSTAIEARDMIDNIGQIVQAGSWTYRGLRALVDPPDTEHNYVIIISTQGSGNSNRQQLALEQFERITALGWRTWVFAVQGVNDIDYVELTSVSTDGKAPQYVTEPNPDPDNPKGFRGLALALGDVLINLCGRTSGVCDKCLYDGGYGFDFDPEYCDSFYRCIYPGDVKIRYACPAGTFWDGITCNHIDKVNCPLAPCSSSAQEGARYTSGRCCNEYFQCMNMSIVARRCPEGEIFDKATSECYAPTDDVRYAECGAMERFECGVSGEGTGTVCPGYGEDPTGDPCYFMFGGLRYRVPAGTYWNQTACTLDHALENYCVMDTVLTDRNMATVDDVCNEMFMATFNGGSRVVTSPRLERDLAVYTIFNEIQFADDSLVFAADAVDPYYYFFHYNNKDIHKPVAFRVKFKLVSPEVGKNYEILSNQFCDLCTATLTFTVAATANRQRTVTATFLTTAGDVVMTTALITKNNNDNYLEMTVIFGNSRVYGQLVEMNGSGDVVQSVDFEEMEKAAESRILMNRCGLQLGRGATANHFVGNIDELAVFELCEDMSSILRA